MRRTDVLALVMRFVSHGAFAKHFKTCALYYRKIPLRWPGEILCERISIRSEPVIDQRSDGISQRRYRARSKSTALISHLVNQVKNTSRKEELSEALFPEVKKFTRTSDRCKQIIKDQGDTVAFELLEHLNKVQCEHCHRHMTSGHVNCNS